MEKEQKNKMTYKTKAAILGSAAFLLALICAFSFIFDQDRAYTRDSSYVWLDAKTVSRVDSLVLQSADAKPLINLKKQNGAWVADAGNAAYPVKQSRVEDLIALLSKKDAYPVRGAEASSLARFGLTEENAARIIAREGESLLLDLLIGGFDAGGGVYLRKNGRNEARSGADAFSFYVSGAKTAWYDLRLFPESEKLALDAVQRVIIALPISAEGLVQKTLILSRAEGGWTVDGKPADTPKAESYIRAVLNAEAEDFAPSPPGKESGRVVLELANGTNRVITLGEPSDGNKRTALVSSSPYAYTLTSATADRLFKDVDSFF
jgi:hypothetical protein